MQRPRQYIAIDLKSFFASVECVERGLDPLDVCLVVADKSRTDKTICLAVSPALKAFGIPGRPRLFEVIQKVRDVNRMRGRSGASTSGAVLAQRPDLAVDYIVAPPRMQKYVDYSARVYRVYLRFVAPEDIHVYSIDEVFIDVTAYLDTYGITAHQLAMRMIREVLQETGITATAGIGSNMYLCKVAMDIVAKKMPPDSDGVRIAEIDEMSYRRQLWTHRPLTDFWRVGRGIARRLEAAGMYTMGDVARASLLHEDWFYHEFGVNAELLIDHAWGWEPVTMEYIKSYRPGAHSMSSGQVLHAPYTYIKALTVIKEMADAMALSLVDKRLVTNHIVLTIGYDIECLSDAAVSEKYDGPVSIDRYGRRVPYPAHGTIKLDEYTSSAKLIIAKTTELFARIVNPDLLVRRLNISVNSLIHESRIPPKAQSVQLDLFVDYDAQLHAREAEEQELAKERRRQETILRLKRKFGKNTILKGLNYAEGATQRDRNDQIGGHKA